MITREDSSDPGLCPPCPAKLLMASLRLASMLLNIARGASHLVLVTTTLRQAAKTALEMAVDKAAEGAAESWHSRVIRKAAAHTRRVPVCAV